MNISELGLEPPYPAPPDRLAPAPRPIAWNGRARLYRTGILCGLLLAPNAVLAWGWLSGQDLRALEDRGKPLVGRVVDKSTWSHRGGRTYRIEYGYEVDGRHYRNTTNVSADEYAAAERNATYPLTYLPDRPNTSTPGRPGPQLTEHNENAVRFAAIVAVGMAVWAGCMRWTLQRERTLARFGEPTLGRITERGTTRGKNQTYYWVRHEYTTPAEVPVSDWHYVPQGLWERLRPGLRVTLLFDPASPKRHLPLYAFKYAYIVEHDEADDFAPAADPVESDVPAAES